MINCEQHDYIEIACIYRYPIELTLLAGDVVKGIAIDTQYNGLREHCIKLRLDDSDLLVPLNNIAKLEALVENPHVKLICFD